MARELELSKEEWGQRATLFATVKDAQDVLRIALDGGLSSVCLDELLALAVRLLGPAVKGIHDLHAAERERHARRGT